MSPQLGNCLTFTQFILKFPKLLCHSLFFAIQRLPLHLLLYVFHCLVFYKGDISRWTAKWSGAKRKIMAGESSWAWPRGDKKVREPIEFVLMPPIHDTRFWYNDVIGQIADCWHVSYEYPWKIPTCPGMLLKPILSTPNPETTSSQLPWKLGH